MILTPTFDLDVLRSACSERLNQSFRDILSRFITPGVEDIYVRKYDQALKYIANPAIDDEEVGYIANEAMALGKTKLEIAQIVIARATFYDTVGPIAESERQRRLALIRDSNDPAVIDQSSKINWEVFLESYLNA